MDQQQLRTALRQGKTADLRRRRAIIAVSLAGMTSMTLVSLFQTGMLKHLPEVPLRGFDSDKVNGAGAAYRLGVPDGTLAAMGGADRAREQPLVPVLAALKGTLDAAIAARYVYEMPAKRGAWSSYSIIAALVDWTVFGLTLPEARRALASAGRD